MSPRPSITPGESVSASTVALAILLLWATFISMNTLRGVVVGSERPDLLLPRRLVVATAGGALSVLIYGLLRLVERRTLGVQAWTAGLAAAPAALVFSLINFSAFALFHPDPEPRAELAQLGLRRMLIVQVSEGIVSWYFVFAAWAAFYLAMSYAQRAAASERNASALREQARIAQLSALRYQVNPHFFFNILNSISTLVMREDRLEAERMISDVSDFFRMSLSADPTEDLPLGEEVTLQQRYLNLEARRFPARLRVTIDVPPDLEQLAVPAMILQPLVENAVRHGLNKSIEPVTITIRAHRPTPNLVEVIVEDDANHGASCEGALHAGHGIGLRNVAARVRARFGPDAKFAAGKREEGGFRAIVTIPSKALA